MTMDDIRGLFGDPRQLIGVTPTQVPAGPMASVAAQPMLLPDVPAEAPRGGLFGTLSSVGRRIRGGLMSAEDAIMPVPTGLGDMVSPEDVSAARRQGLLRMGLTMLSDASPANSTTAAPSLGQAFAHGAMAGQDAFGGSIQDTLGQRQFAQQQELTQQALAHQRQVLATRAAVMAKYPAKPGETQPETMQRLRMIISELYAAGDMDGVKALSGAQGSLFAAPPRPLPVIRSDVGNKVDYVDPTTGKTITSTPKGPPPRDPNAVSPMDRMLFSRASGLADDFRVATKDYPTIATQLGQILTLGPAALKKSPMAQMSMIYSYMKLLDPRSTVRESEYASVKNAAGVPDRVRNQWNALRDGALLTDNQIRDIMRQTSSIRQSWINQFQPIKQSYDDRARASGVDPSMVTYDYFKSSAAPASAADSTAPTGGAKVRKYLPK